MSIEPGKECLMAYLDRDLVEQVRTYAKTHEVSTSLIVEVALRRFILERLAEAPPVEREPAS